MSALYEWSRGSKAKKAAAFLIETAKGFVMMCLILLIYSLIFKESDFAGHFERSWYILLPTAAAASVTMLTAYAGTPEGSSKGKLPWAFAMAAAAGAMVLAFRDTLTGAQASLWIGACMALGALLVLVDRMFALLTRERN